MHKGAHEVKGSFEILESINGKPVMSKMTYEKLTWLVSKNLSRKFEEITPKEWREILKVWGQASE